MLLWSHTCKTKSTDLEEHSQAANLRHRSRYETSDIYPSNLAVMRVSTVVQLRAWTTETDDAVHVRSRHCCVQHSKLQGALLLRKINDVYVHNEIVREIE